MSPISDRPGVGYSLTDRCSANVHPRSRSLSRRCLAPSDVVGHRQSDLASVVPHFLVSICAIAIFFLLGSVARAAEKSPSEESLLAKGKILYLQHCIACHQTSGQGTPGAFPPLANSDFLLANKLHSVKIVVEGFSDIVTVNGKTFKGFMPPAVLNDQQVAEVLTFVRNSWGNSGEAVTADEVKKVRAKTQFPTFEALVKANAYLPLPKPPEGFTLREVARMPNHPTRLISDHKGKALYALCFNGDVLKIDIATGTIIQILWGSQYLDLKLGETFIVGATLDSQNRLYIVSNQRNESVNPVNSEVIIYRTTRTEKGEPANPQPWFRTSYPWGTGNHHAVGHIAFGPDGYLYVNSGSRTDSNDAGDDPKIAKIGETPLTACMWRFDPKSDRPELEIYARGLRNNYGFCWNDKGEMFGTENGPNRDAPEELNQIERGKHYGFPYFFSDMSEKLYPYTPDPPSGQQFELPVANLGPDAGFNGKPRYTFDPHSSPAGIVFLGNDFPRAYRGTFFIVRFGILIEQPKDFGFDLLQARLQKNAQGKYQATVKTILAPLARPLDIVQNGKGKLYIAEYCRSITFKGSLGLPGRILELAVKP